MSRDASLLQVLDALQQAVDTRCHNIEFPAPNTSSNSPSPKACSEAGDAPVLVLFSGGVDSTLLAALAHRALPPGAPIDLASICFDNGQSPDRYRIFFACQGEQVFCDVPQAAEQEDVCHISSATVGLLHLQTAPVLLLASSHSTAQMLVQQGVMLCRQSAIDALAELREYAPDRQWRLIQVAGSLAALDRNKPHLLGESCCHLCF